MTRITHSTPLLEASTLCKRFGGLTALDGVSFTVYQGEICGLIGPNGAGKTTLFNVITGLYTADSGRLLFAGQAIYHAQPYQIAQHGIARTFQNIRLFGTMTALENVMVGHHARAQSGVLGAIFNTTATRQEEQQIRETSQGLLTYCGLGNQAQTVASQLPYGDQRRLEIARALAAQPRLLALDEPAAGMNATETNTLRALLERITSDGITILLIEHDMSLVMQVCHRVVVLDQGRHLAAGTPQEIQKNPAVIAAYLGSSV